MPVLALLDLGVLYLLAAERGHLQANLVAHDIVVTAAEIHRVGTEAEADGMVLDVCLLCAFAAVLASSS